jgi:hypothetical protein
MRGTLLLASIATLAALTVAPAAALGGASRAASNTATYPDSIGEDPNAPDITATTVSNDDKGLITFHLAIANRAALTPDMLIELDLDTDGNASTGDSRQLVPGTDFIIQLTPGAVDLFKWSGSDFPGVAAPSLVYAYDATGATIRVNASELGDTHAFDFAAIAISGLAFSADGSLDISNAHADFTPDPGHGAFAYEVEVTVTLAAAAFTTSPKTVRAGKPFSVGLAATESDTGGPVRQGIVTCAAHVAGKALRATSRRLVNGIAVCAWRAPKTAQGKLVTGSITLDAKGAKISRAFSVHVS